MMALKLLYLYSLTFSALIVRTEVLGYQATMIANNVRSSASQMPPPKAIAFCKSEVSLYPTASLPIGRIKDATSMYSPVPVAIVSTQS